MQSTEQQGMTENKHVHVKQQKGPFLEKIWK